MKIYNRILELRPAWTEKVAVVMTESNKDPEEWCKIIGNKHHKDELAQKFKALPRRLARLRGWILPHGVRLVTAKDLS